MQSLEPTIRKRERRRKEGRRKKIRRKEEKASKERRGEARLYMAAFNRLSKGKILQRLIQTKEKDLFVA